MSIVNGGEPTAAKRIRELMTTLVELPELTRRAGHPVRVRIRVISAAEYLDATQELATSVMEQEDREKYLKELNEDQRREVARKGNAADEKILALAVISPRVVLEDEEKEDTIPMSALRPDRIILIQKILTFSGLMGEPAPGVQEAQKSLPFPGKGGPVGAGPGDVGPVGETAVRDAPAVAG